MNELLTEEGLKDQLKDKLMRYQYAYDILMDHFNEFNHDTQIEVDKKLKELKL